MYTVQEQNATYTLLTIQCTLTSQVWNDYQLNVGLTRLGEATLIKDKPPTPTHRTHTHTHTHTHTQSLGWGVHTQLIRSQKIIM